MLISSLSSFFNTNRIDQLISNQVPYYSSLLAAKR